MTFALSSPYLSARGLTRYFYEGVSDDRGQPLGHFASGRSNKQQTNNKQTKAIGTEALLNPRRLTPPDGRPDVVVPYLCHW